MFKSENEIQKIVDGFCNEKNLDKNIFEVSSISSATGGKQERLYNNTPVKNKKCTYVIKYYCKLDRIIIWNYKLSKSMSYSLKTINEKLNRGIKYADKGSNFHTKKQSLVYFGESVHLVELLNKIFPSI